jgi:glyoxylase-like metal-dependent hydrolase (beta-lactamase superfamily II)
MLRAVKFLSVFFLLMILVLLWFLRGGFATFDTSPYPIPRQSSQTWDEVLKNPGSITVRTFDTGEIKMDQAQNLDPNNPKIRSCPHGDSPLPVLVHLLHHDRYGDFLIDTGFGGSFSINPPYGNYSDPMQLLNWASGIKNRQQPGQNIAAHLKRPEVRLNAVFFTHLHPDHTAGAVELPQNIDYVFGKAENWFLARAFIGDHFANKKNLRTIDFTNVKDMPPLGSAIDIFGDGSLWAVSTPGHTRDHISYVVNAKSGPVLLAGDASQFRWAFENNVAPRGLNRADTTLAQRSLEQLFAFSTTYPKVKIIFGHGFLNN